MSVRLRLIGCLAKMHTMAITFNVPNIPSDFPHSVTKMIETSKIKSNIHACFNHSLKQHYSYTKFTIQTQDAIFTNAPLRQMEILCHS